MADANKHECIIGCLFDYDDTDLVTEERLSIEAYYSGTYTMGDFTDFRKTTNLHRFRFCPECGKEIDWKAMRKRWRECPHCGKPMIDEVEQ